MSLILPHRTIIACNTPMYIQAVQKQTGYLPAKKEANEQELANILAPVAYSLSSTGVDTATGPQPSRAKSHSPASPSVRLSKPHTNLTEEENRHATARDRALHDVCANSPTPVTVEQFEDGCKQAAKELHSGRRKPNSKHKPRRRSSAPASPTSWLSSKWS